MENNPRWINYDEYMDVHKLIINKNGSNITEENINKLIKLINDTNINEKDNH